MISTDPVQAEAGAASPIDFGGPTKRTAERNISVRKCTVVIPSYQRGAVALATIEALRALPAPPAEILLMDQTSEHPVEVGRCLQRLNRAGVVRWLRLPEPSIPRAMNVGLREARMPLVLFVDDDIVPDPWLIEAHSNAHSATGPALVAGMVLQPGQQPATLRPGERFRFNSDVPADVTEFMGGNFSVRRNVALELGGFDENFVGAAYRFEAEFAHRYVATHGKIRYEPRAVIKHLAIPSGGTRAHGSHLRTMQPEHSVGAYYFLLRCRPIGWLWQLLWRPIRSIRTRHHLQRPWWIPLTLVAEVRGFVWALRLALKGPKHMASKE